MKQNYQIVNFGKYHCGASIANTPIIRDRKITIGKGLMLLNKVIPENTYIYLDNSTQGIRLVPQQPLYIASDFNNIRLELPFSLDGTFTLLDSSEIEIVVFTDSSFIFPATMKSREFIRFKPSSNLTEISPDYQRLNQHLNCNLIKVYTTGTGITGSLEYARQQFYYRTLSAALNNSVNLGVISIAGSYNSQTLFINNPDESIFIETYGSLTYNASTDFLTTELIFT